MDQKDFEPAYKIAYFARRIEPSQETDQNASGLASQFAGENRDKAAYDAAVKKGNLKSIASVPEIQPTDFNIQGLGSSRSLVRWIFGAKLGEVSESFPIGDKYVVAVLTDEIIKRNHEPGKSKTYDRTHFKKSEKSRADFGKNRISRHPGSRGIRSGQPISHVDSLQFSSPYIPNFGPEPKVVGYSFDKQLVGKAVSSGMAEMKAFLF